MSGGRLDLYFGLLPMVSFSGGWDRGGEGLLGMPRQTESGEGKAGCEGVIGENVGTEGVSGDTPVVAVDNGAIGDDTTDEEGEFEKKDLGP